MKKHLTHLAALVLSGAIALSFVGCADTPAETTTEPAATTTAATTTAQTTTAENTTTVATTTAQTTTETTTAAPTPAEATTTAEETTTAAAAFSAEDIAAHAELPIWGEGTECIPNFNSRPRIPVIPSVVPYLVEGSDACVVIYPGGGYYQLSWDSEGTVIAKAYNEKGISAFVVRYRYYPHGASNEILADGQRAIQFIRYYAEDFGIDPEKIAVCGFSAGGHLAMVVSQHAPTENLAGDAIGEVSSAPNACILSYAVTTLVAGSSQSTAQNFLTAANLNNEEMIAKYSYGHNLVAMPDTFIWYSTRDTTVDYKMNSEALAAALQAIGTNVKCIAYQDGGHGIGLATTYNQASGWHAASVDFLNAVFAD